MARWLALLAASISACGVSAETPDAPPSADARAGALDAGLTSLDEEFDSPDALNRLADLFPALHDTLSVAGGKLAMTPLAVPFTHWYSDAHGPFLAKTVTGKCVVEIDVAVGRRTDMSLPPRGSFSAAGLVVRDPASTAPGAERWVMYNVGHQVSSVARETKTTRPNAGGSLSTLYLVDTPGAAQTGRLRICRVGSTFYFFHRHPTETSFVEEAYGAGTVAMGNGAGVPTPGVVVGGVIRFDRPDMPATLQVGLIVGNWDGTLETRGEFDYLRFGPAQRPADCTAPLP